jgi:glycosyltransferase involved in cell wall biosynthesis
MVANDVVASSMAGPGIRSFELACQLAGAGHQVTLAADGAADLTRPGLVLVPRPSPIEMHALAQQQDAVMVQGLSLRAYPALLTLHIPLIVDLYDPFPLSLLEQEGQLSERERITRSARVSDILIEQLKGGDFFICASERQRDLWIGALMSVGRVNPPTWSADNSLRRLIDIVPFGLPSEPPQASAGRPVGFPDAVSGEDVVLLWGGGIYNWFDPLTLIRAVAQVSASRPQLKLVFMSTHHPNPGIPPQMWMPQLSRQLATDLGVAGKNVFFNSEWIPYERRSDWLLSSTCGVSTHFDHAETRFSFRTRILDYLWAGLPIITTQGDVLADLVEAQDLGWTVPAQAVGPLSSALEELVEGVGRRKEMGARVRAVARTMTWTRAAQPLLDYCDSPWVAADDPRVEFRRYPGPSRANLRTQRSRQLLTRGWTSLRQQGVGATVQQVRARLGRGRGR